MQVASNNAKRLGIENLSPKEGDLLKYNFASPGLPSTSHRIFLQHFYFKTGIVGARVKYESLLTSEADPFNKAMAPTISLPAGVRHDGDFYIDCGMQRAAEPFPAQHVPSDDACVDITEMAFNEHHAKRRIADQ